MNPTDQSQTPDLPQGIALERHRDFQGRELGQWIRRVVLTLLLVFLVAALLNVFGQGTTTSSAEGAAASLTVTAPTRLRGGLLYQARFRIHANQSLRAPVLALDRGWFDETTVNAIEPEAAGTTSDDHTIKLRYPPLAAGRTLIVYIAMQANPTNVGSHTAGVSLYDGARLIASVDRTQINFP
ncbi:MAG TPA: hypothetical protein VF731_07155 [Solirubrobacterales bacterium]